MIVQELIERNSGAHGEVLEMVTDLVLNSHPGVQCMKKYTVPFFVLKKNILYLDIQKELPILGVIQGVNLKNIEHLLDFTNRTQVGHFSLLNMDQERYQELLLVVAEAVDFDLNSSK